MAQEVRRQRILELARREGGVRVAALAELFGVTVQTIRRDLGDLSAEGRLHRRHGGATVEAGPRNLEYETRRGIAAEAKARIGRLCAAEIPDGASLIMNIGTTTEAVARALCNAEDLTVITNNLNVANILAGYPDCEIMIAGGLFRRTDGGIVGDAAVAFLRRFKVDIAVIGASAIDEDGTLLDFDDREVEVTREIIANARRVYLVADASKTRRRAPIRVAGLERIDALFTDRPLPAPLAEICAEAGTALHVAAG